MANRSFLITLSAAILALLPEAGTTNLVRADAPARVAARREDEDEKDRGELLIQLPPRSEVEFAGHSSHSSHSSHRSHSSHASGSSSHESHSSHSSHYSGGSTWRGSGSGWSSGSGSSSSGESSYVPAAVARPRPPKPVAVSFAAFPGGKIYVNDVYLGKDITGAIVLEPGTHTVRIENRFLGTHNGVVEVIASRPGLIRIEW